MSLPRLAPFGVVSLAVLALAGCQKQKHEDVIVGGHPLTVAARLTCPDVEGRLKRVSAAADGQSCVYSSPDGSEITLSRLVLNNQSSTEALKAVEARLAPVPWSDAASPSPPKPPEASDKKSPEANDKTATASWSNKTAKADAKDEDEDSDDNDDSGSRSGSGGHHVHIHGNGNIDLPGLHIHTNGDQADIRMPGLHVNAQDGGGAVIQTGWGGMGNMVINANDGGALIRSDNTDAGNTQKMWMRISDEALPDGYHVVGYFARGPNAGPLVVGVIKSKRSHDHSFDHNLGFDVIKKLVGANVK